MLSAQNKSLLHIFNLIYVANDSPNLLVMRHNVLKLVIPLFRASGATFFLSDKNLRGIDVSSGISYCLDTVYSRLYQQYYHKLEPFHEVIYSNQICTTSDLTFPREKWENLEYYNHFLKPQKIHHELIICLRSEGKLFGKIGVFREKNDPEFDSYDIEKASLISRHLGGIIKNTRMREDYEKSTSFYKVLTECPLMAVMVLDFNFRPVYINEAAANMCLEIAGGRPDANSLLRDGSIPVPEEVLRDCRALKNDIESGTAVSRLFRINSIYNGHGKRYSVKSYLNTQPVAGIEPPSFLVMMEDNSEIKQMRETAARLRFGLTYRELEICGFINEGLTNDEIARQLFISRFTIETHIRHIFEKTKAKNRTELIKLLGIFNN